MQLRNSTNRFGLVSIALHWSIAFLIIGLIGLGYYMVGLTYYDRWYNASLSWHKSLGMIVLGLALLKLGWRVYSPAPAPAAGLKAWERLGARGMHVLLLAMMLVIPVSGYFISTSAGQAVDIFGWASIPALQKLDAEGRDLAIAVHFYAAYATALLVLGHAGAALKHHFINRDDTLRRML